MARLTLAAGFPDSSACPASDAVFRPEVVRRPVLRLESSLTFVPCCFPSAASCLARSPAMRIGLIAWSARGAETDEE